MATRAPMPKPPRPSLIELEERKPSKDPRVTHRPRPSLIELEQRKPSKDPRVTHRGRYSAWLWKVKSSNAVMKWMKESSSRFFTIDFDQQIFYYSHSEGSMNMSHLVSFKNILGAEQHPPSFGFSVKTHDRTYMLYSTSNADAALWVAAVKAARDLGKLEVRKLEQKGDAGFQTAREEQMARWVAEAVTEAEDAGDAVREEKTSDNGKLAHQADGKEGPPKEDEPYTAEAEDPSCNFERTSDVSTCDDDEMPVKHSRISRISTCASGGLEDWGELPRSDRSDSSDSYDSNDGPTQQQASKATAPVTADFDNKGPGAGAQAHLHFDMCTAHTIMIKIIAERLSQRFGCFAFFFNYMCFNSMVPCQYV